MNDVTTYMAKEPTILAPVMIAAAYNLYQGNPLPYFVVMPGAVAIGVMNEQMERKLRGQPMTHWMTIVTEDLVGNMFKTWGMGLAADAGLAALGVVLRAPM
jgi:hypothetical protein